MKLASSSYYCVVLIIIFKFPLSLLYLLLKCLLQGTLVSFPVTYICHHLYQYGFMDICFFLWTVNQYSNYLFHCTNCANFSHLELFLLGSSVFFFFLYSPFLLVSMCPGGKGSFLCFLALQGDPDSLSLFLASTLKSDMF